MTTLKRAIPVTTLAALCCLAVVAPPTSAAPSGGPMQPADVAWLLTASAFVLFMTPGLAFFYGGMVQRKNVIATMFQSFIAMAAISVLWVVVGFSLAFGPSLGGLIGNPLTYFMFRNVGGATHADLSPTIPLLLFAMFQLKFAIITPALITGAFAERFKFKPYMLFVVLWSILIYAPLAHWTWHPDGFLRKMGVLDFAGGTVVHMSAGWAALAGALVLGPRKAHLHEDGHTPANIPYVLLGAAMLWFGWFGFNAGSALAANDIATIAFATTNTAGASAAVAWVFWDIMRDRKPSAMGAAIGAVVGLVAITPAAGFVSVGSSVLIGIVASSVSYAAVALRARSSVDDTLDVFPCHGLGGIVGMILTGVFAKDQGLIAGTTKVFYAHIIALALVSVFAFVGSYLLYRAVDRLVSLRVSEDHERLGLDLSQHGESLDGVYDAALVEKGAFDPMLGLGQASPAPVGGE